MGENMFFFFFQAEDGIRDLTVTGVQTCALPILLEEEKKRTQTVLDEGIRTLRERGFNAIGQLAVGEPVEEICRFAKNLGVDLIVVGHNQNTSFAARWWKGSVGASLLDYAPCSILIALSKM